MQEKREDEMSIQIVSCSPYRWFKHWCAFPKPATPWAMSGQFARAVKERTGVQLSRLGLGEFAEDLMSKVMWDLGVFMRATCSKDVQDGMGASVYIPTRAPLPKDVHLPFSWYEAGDLTLVRSTDDFREALEAVATTAASQAIDMSRFNSHLDCYRQAITFAEKHRFPIYWSM